ncbi:hypothetical protein EHRUM3_04350 [Ehrlichia ruminantium]|uniref:Uncharacterized protein n=1 Tax=Ehrlichia ruminantium TaxID=779 RepID=A0A161M1E0_EHRRU|nr:hypothetical protein EHRUM3_04350 [Ehrlichia ruminantium]
MNPMINITKKIIIDQNPPIPISERHIDHGNKNAISRSNMMNSIATK